MIAGQVSRVEPDFLLSRIWRRPVSRVVGVFDWKLLGGAFDVPGLSPTDCRIFVRDLYWVVLFFRWEKFPCMAGVAADVKQQKADRY